MLRKISFLMLLALLSGCSVWGAAKAGINHYGGTYEQGKLEAAEFGLCVQPAIGAIRWRYSGVALERYQNFCGSISSKPNAIKENAIMEVPSEP